MYANDADGNEPVPMQVGAVNGNGKSKGTRKDKGKSKEKSNDWRTSNINRLDGDCRTCGNWDRPSAPKNNVAIVDRGQSNSTVKDSAAITTAIAQESDNFLFIIDQEVNVVE